MVSRAAVARSELPVLAKDMARSSSVMLSRCTARSISLVLPGPMARVLTHLGTLKADGSLIRHGLLSYAGSLVRHDAVQQMAARSFIWSTPPTTAHSFPMVLSIAVVRSSAFGALATLARSFMLARS